MPVFSYEPRTVNDKSNLSAGMHPAFLLAIRDEETPDGWAMKEKSPRMWRWLFAVFASEATIQQSIPEHQSATSTQTFSPGGKFQPSKAFVWSCKLVGHKIEAGESIDLDPMLPLPCWVMVTRTKSDGTPIEYANIASLEAWPEGMALLTPAFRASLEAFLHTEVTPQQATAPVSQPQYAQPARPVQVPTPPAQAPQAPLGWPSAPAGQTPAGNGSQPTVERQAGNPNVAPKAGGVRW